MLMQQSKNLEVHLYALYMLSGSCKPILSHLTVSLPPNIRYLGRIHLVQHILHFFQTFHHWVISIYATLDGFLAKPQTHWSSALQHLYLHEHRTFWYYNRRNSLQDVFTYQTISYPSIKISNSLQFPSCRTPFQDLTVDTNWYYRTKLAQMRQRCSFCYLETLQNPPQLFCIPLQLPHLHPLSLKDW